MVDRSIARPAVDVTALSCFNHGDPSAIGFAEGAGDRAAAKELFLARVGNLLVPPPRGA